MNKEEFFKKLEKKLKVLSPSEKEDIINEYHDIISEKIKHGKTEEEAIKEFGNIDDLAKEILSAYKINPNYDENKILNDCEDVINKAAKKLGEVTDNVIDSVKQNEKISTNKIFEVIIKVFIVLFVLMLLKIPFAITGHIGYGIFSSFSIFNYGFVPHLWEFIVEIVYFVICILLIYTVVSKYFFQNNDVSKQDTKKFSTCNNTSKKTTENKKEDSNESNEDIKNNKVKYVRHNDTLGDVLIVLLKLFIFFTIIFPLIMVNLGLIIALCVIIWLLIKGIEIYGLLILMIGFIVGCFTITELFIKLLVNAKKVNLAVTFASIITGIILVMVGSLMTFDYFSNLNYHDDLSEKYVATTETYDVNILKTTRISADEIIIDQSLTDNKAKITVKYYKEISDIDKKEYEECLNYESICEEKINRIDIDVNYHNYHNWHEIPFIDETLEDLKHNNVYNYSLLEDRKVVLYVNNNTRTLIID